MLVNLVFVNPEGERELFAEHVDLDYWSIRQFRNMYFSLLDKNKDLDYESVKLYIEPYKTKVF